MEKTDIRMWPGIAIVTLQWLAWFILPIVRPEAIVTGIFGGLLGGLALAVWWAFFSRARRSESWGAISLIIISLYITSHFIHESIATGAQGMMFVMFSVPVISLTFLL